MSLLHPPPLELILIYLKFLHVASSLGFTRGAVAFVAASAVAVSACFSSYCFVRLCLVFQVVCRLSLTPRPSPIVVYPHYREESAFVTW